jgi:hypothetical protein
MPNDESQPDQINPKHYRSHPSRLECIAVTRHHNFNVGNAIKYLWRCGLKEGEDVLTALQKAAWYVADEIARVKALPYAPRERAQKKGLSAEEEVFEALKLLSARDDETLRMVCERRIMQHDDLVYRIDRYKAALKRIGDGDSCVPAALIVIAKEALLHPPPSDGIFDEA